MPSLEQRLSAKNVLIADGGWGTQFANLGLPPGEAPEKWNLDRPDDVRSVAESYVTAGADVILTNTFGGSRYKLEKVGLADRLAEVNRAGAELSKQAAGEAALVFASVGPTGEFMEPVGTITETDMVACFAEQIRALIDGGADGIVVETMMDLGEARAALKAAKDTAACPVVVSMTYEKGAKGYATMMGVTPEQAAAELEAAGADVIGANCGAGMDRMIEMIQLLRHATGRPIWAKPNAGLPQLIEGKTVFKETPEQMAQLLPALVQAGAAIIGGCCGTTPDHIRAFKEVSRTLS
ncbi:MAG: homocysteine S-methyltransferase family protein [Phycisphaerae bacterium]|nr:homocysteine S-methyltransferase family protein [Phycisphaerae bacterium]